MYPVRVPSLPPMGRNNNALCLKAPVMYVPALSAFSARTQATKPTRCQSTQTGRPSETDMNQDNTCLSPIFQSGRVEIGGNNQATHRAKVGSANAVDLCIDD